MTGDRSVRVTDASVAYPGTAATTTREHGKQPTTTFDTTDFELQRTFPTAVTIPLRGLAGARNAGKAGPR